MQVLNTAVLIDVAGGLINYPSIYVGPPTHPNDHGGGVSCFVWKGDEVYADYYKRLAEYNARNPKAA